MAHVYCTTVRDWALSSRQMGGAAIYLILMIICVFGKDVPFGSWWVSSCLIWPLSLQSIISRFSAIPASRIICSHTAIGVLHIVWRLYATIIALLHLIHVLCARIRIQVHWAVVVKVIQVYNIKCSLTAVTTVLILRPYYYYRVVDPSIATIVNFIFS